MRHLSAQHARRLAFRLVACQLALAAGIGLLFALFAGWGDALSAWIGGGVVTAGTYYQARISFSPRAAGDPKRVANALYAGEAAKMGTIVVLLGLALYWLRLAPGPLFTAFIATLLVNFAALLATARRGTGQSDG